MPSARQTEFDGLKDIRLLNADYLKCAEGSKQVREFLKRVHQDEKLLSKFLRGRKYNAKYAWETLKRYAEVRFDIYTELFPKQFSSNVRTLANSEILGVLKIKDKLGRRVDLIDFGSWDPDKFTLDELTILGVKIADAKHVDNEGIDGMENGTVVIVQCSKLQARHVKEITIPYIRRTIDVFLHSYPVRLKGAFFVNVPIVFSGFANVIKYFLSNKIKQRAVITSGDCKDCKELITLISIEELPKSFGGPLEFYDAVEDLNPLLG